MISMSKGRNYAMVDIKAIGAMDPETCIFQNWAYDCLHMTLQQHML